ncbi:MAG: tetratricopeptide repeat-containing sensor histidine kinase [Bacteroidota bacterium]
MIKLYQTLLVLSGLLFAMSCNRQHPPDNGQGQVVAWEKIEDKALASSKSNLDTMLLYSRQLYDEAVKAENMKWEAKALVLLGYCTALKEETDSSIILYEKAKKLANSIKDSVTVEKTFNYLGSCYLGTGLYSKAEQEYLGGLAYAENLHDTFEIVKYYNNLGNVAENLDNLGEAQKYIHKALFLSEKRKDTLTMASSMRNLALILHKSGDSVMAFRYLRSSLSLFASINDTRWVAKIYTDFGIFYRYQFPDSALYFYTKAIEIYRSLGDEGTILITQFNMANLLLDKGKYREAEKVYLRIYKKTVKENNFIGQAYSSISLASAYQKLMDFPNSTKYIQKAEELGARWNQPDFTKNLYAIKIEILNAQGKYREAIGVYKKFVSLKDSLGSADTKARILDLQSQFDNERKEFEIVALKQQTAIQQNKLRNRFVLIIGLVVFLSIIILSLGIIIYLYRKSASAYKKLTEQSDEMKKEILIREKIQRHLAESEQQLIKMNATKDKFFSIIAHDLKNPFSAILGFTELLTTDLQNLDKDEIRYFLNNISNATTHAYTLLENLLIWAQTQNKTIEFKPEVLDLKKAVDEAILLVDSQAMTKNINILSSISEKQLVFADLNLISAILRNLLTNAVKFTPQNGHVEISARLNENKVEISVRDSGMGIEKEHLHIIFSIENTKRRLGTAKEKGSGLGLTLCKEFTEMVGGTISVESEPGKGSTFTFTVPVNNQCA